MTRRTRVARAIAALRKLQEAPDPDSALREFAFYMAGAYPDETRRAAERFLELSRPEGEQ